VSAISGFVRRHKILAVALALLGALTVDSLRPASSQLSVRAYAGVVHTYQRVARPALSRCVHCRCQPTCSEYSVQAVRSHGFVPGVFLTGCRLVSCADLSIRAYLRQTQSVDVQTMMPNKVTGANSRPASQFESRGLRRRALVVESQGRYDGGAAVAQFCR
jgi:putative component of membrane protein insertase Oxa1/YidC/SpoIIIJ protein YidD